MILIRYLLICIIGYLVIRAFLKLSDSGNSSSMKNTPDNNTPPKKISKEIGEYIDYEEIKKKKEKQQR